MDRLKAEAARLGANGILLEASAIRPADQWATVDPLTTLALSGTDRKQPVTAYGPYRKDQQSPHL